MHDNAPCHRSVVVSQFLAKKQIVTINHSPYSPDLPPCDYFLFPKLKIAIKGHHYNDVDDIKGTMTSILKAIPKTDIEKSFHALIDRANRCIDSEKTYFEYNKIILGISCVSTFLRAQSGNFWNALCMPYAKDLPPQIKVRRLIDYTKKKRVKPLGSDANATRRRTVRVSQRGIIARLSPWHSHAYSKWRN